MGNWLLILSLIYISSNINYLPNYGKETERIRSLGIISQTIYTVSNGDSDYETKRDSSVSIYTEYDRNGHKIKLISHLGKGLSMSELSYYGNGDILDSSVSKIDVNSRTICTFRDKYDPKGYCTYRLFIFADTKANHGKAIDTIYYDYLYKGNSITITPKSRESNTIGQFVRILDKDSNVIEERFSEKDTNTSAGDYIKYDLNGFRIEMDVFNNSDSLHGKTIYHNDGKGNVDEYIEYDNADNVMSKYKAYYEYY